jgi:hypothetical protein
MKRNAEQNFELGAVKFTLSLKSGLNFFIDNDFVERDAKAICPLHNKQGHTRQDPDGRGTAGSQTRPL